MELSFIFDSSDIAWYLQYTSTDSRTNLSVYETRFNRALVRNFPVIYISYCFDRVHFVFTLCSLAGKCIISGI